ncbi:MAG: 50S ribosomal protein L25 [Deltaproteobacteria bacterium]|nr:50S ribosomal protein L25 [Deltaproteobacteria bacterium]
MAYEKVTLQSKERDNFSKSHTRFLRREGFIPAILYGKHVKNNIALAVAPKELSKILQKKGENAIITMEGLKEERSALVKDIQRHPVTDKYLHADFLEINLAEKIEVQVPFEFEGTPQGVREKGGTLQVALREITVKCLPGDIPDHIKVDVSALDLHDSVHIEEIKVDPKIELVFDANLTIASVVPPVKEEEAVAAAPAAGEEVKATEEAKGAVESKTEPKQPKEKATAKPEGKKADTKKV